MEFSVHNVAESSVIGLPGRIAWFYRLVLFSTHQGISQILRIMNQCSRSAETAFMIFCHEVHYSAFLIFWHGVEPKARYVSPNQKCFRFLALMELLLRFHSWPDFMMPLPKKADDMSAPWSRWTAIQLRLRLRSTADGWLVGECRFSQQVSRNWVFAARA